MAGLKQLFLFIKFLDMITIKEFIKLEGNDYTMKFLLEAIDKLKNSNIESQEFTFNVYSMVIFPKKNEVCISNDIFPDENPSLIVSIDEFLNEIKKSNK